MNFLETFKVALEAILSNKMRSGLTMLGVIIGVLAVILLVSIGEGARVDPLWLAACVFAHETIGEKQPGAKDEKMDERLAEEVV